MSIAAPLAFVKGASKPWARPGHWIAGAWRRFGWRQVALAALFAVLAALLAPNGGVILLFRGSGLSILIGDLLGGRWITLVPLLFAAMVADEAYRDGVRPVPAYAAALALGWLASTLLDALGADAFGTWRFNQFRVKFLLAQGSLCMAVYAYWRTTQHALERIQRSEADRIRDRQKLLAARLLALQARVEPQFLFDALSRIGELHERDPQAADLMLADLIALLRAMLPVGTAATSTVEREFALASAWLRVQRHIGAPIEVDVATSPLATQSALGAMLVLPLLQEMLALPRARSIPWQLSAEPVASGDAIPRTPRLRVRLAPVEPAPAIGVAADATTPTLARLRERLDELYGREATLVVQPLGDGLAIFILELPLVQETFADDHRPDR